MLSSAGPPDSARLQQSRATFPSDRLPLGPDNAPLRALVVDDAADTRELFSSEMEAVGFKVARAASGEAALEQVRVFDPDVIVLDLMLPGINGFDVARAVRASRDRRAIAILAVTALTSEIMRRLALEAGCDVVLCKPVVASLVVDEAHLLIDARQRGRSSSDGTL
jgi:DNA-binding response OmpR family regulator